jgi:hypothetical protein
MRAKLLRLLLALTTATLAWGCASVGRLSLVVGPAADLASTQWAKAEGAREANPLIGQSDAKLIGVKVAQAGILLWADSHLKAHPKARKMLRIIAGGVSFGLAAHNVQVGLEAQRERR